VEVLVGFVEAVDHPEAVGVGLEIAFGVKAIVEGPLHDDISSLVIFDGDWAQFDVEFQKWALEGVGYCDYCIRRIRCLIFEQHCPLLTESSILISDIRIEDRIGTCRLDWIENGLSLLKFGNLDWRFHPLKSEHLEIFNRRIRVLVGQELLEIDRK
jgi:hypothetical protein